MGFIFPDNSHLMDIRSPAGTRVRYRGAGGYESNVEMANEWLEVGAVYVVDSTDIGAWRTDVYLKEFPGIGFNSVMFEKEEQR